MKTQVLFNIVDTNNKIHKLTFELYNSSLAKRWRSIVERNIQENNSIHSSFINLTYDRISEVLIEFNNIVAVINKLYDKQLPKFINTDILDQQILNDLHEEYEIYGDRLQSFIDMGYFDEPKKFTELYNPLWPGDVQNFVLHDHFLRLNELIHTCEELIENKNNLFIPMSALIDYYPQGLHETLQDIDKLYLTTNFTWGKLYLGYNTLGKDWLEVQRHNDIDVIKRNQVRPQERFAAECWLNFTQDDNNNWTATNFENWYTSLPDDIKSKVPVNNISELCLGRFEIGYLAITSELVNYHSNIDDWLSTEHPIKGQWNREVFSTFKAIKSIEFKDF